jgi:ankyrin repeat protein
MQKRKSNQQRITLVLRPVLARSLKMGKTLSCSFKSLGVCLLLTLSSVPTWAALDVQSLTIAMRGDKAKLEALVANSPEVKGEVGARAIYLQSLFGNFEGIEILIAHGADINYREPLNGYTPLHDAVTYAGRWTPDPGRKMLPMDITVARNKFKTAELLIAHGADVNVKSKYGETPLHKAGTKELAELLIKHGANVNDKTPGNTPLYFAAGGSYREEVVEVLVAHGADVSYKNPSGVTPLHTAVENNQEKTVAFLLKHGAGVGAKDQNGTTPWDIVVRENKDELTPIFLNNGTKLNLMSKDGIPDLHKAVTRGNKLMVGQLLSHGAQVNTTDRNGDTALLLAISYFHNDIAKLLIEHGADVNVKSRSGTPLLHRTNNKDSLELLIDHGADINAKDGSGNNLLHVATSKGFAWTVKLLLAHKVDVNVRNSVGQTPLLNAIFRQGRLVVPELRSALQGEYGVGMWERVGAKSGTASYSKAKSSFVHENEAEYEQNNMMPSFAPSTEVIKLLLAHGADVMEKDRNNGTLLHIAPTAEISDLLIARGAQVDAQRNDGATALHLAAAYGKTAVVKTLLAQGAGVSARTKDGVTPLHYAKNAEIAGLLLTSGADANAKAKDGLTPLHYAKGPEIVKLLLANGVDVNSADKDGNTPLHMAGERAVVMLLLDHGANLNGRNNSGQTPLLRMVRLLKPVVRPIANVIALDGPIDSPLEYAPSRERGGSIETLNALLDQGADVNLDDNEGFMPLHYVRVAMKKPVFAELIGPLKEIEGLLISHGAKLEKREKEPQGFPPELAVIPQISLGTRVMMQIDIQYEERKKTGKENHLYYGEPEMMPSTPDKFAFDDNQQLLDYFQSLSAEVRKNGLWVKRMARHLWTPPDKERIDKLTQSAISKQIPLFLCAPSASQYGSWLVTWECDRVSPQDSMQAISCKAVESKGRATRWECRWRED